MTRRSKKTMQAVVLHEPAGPDALKLEARAIPEPKPGEARVALKAAAINRRDVWISLNQYAGIRLPCILGSDGAGVVDAIGEGVDASLLGREAIIYPVLDWGDDPRASGPRFRVFGMPEPGTFADYTCVPAECIYARPAHLDWQQAAALPLCGLTAWRALVVQGGADARSRVLVTGIGGGVATTAMLLALGMGCEVWVTSSDPAKIERAKALGAAGGVNYRDAEWAKTLRKQAGAIDVVIDGTGGIDVNRVFDALNVGARVVLYGATAGSAPAGPNLVQLFFKQFQIRGSTMGTPYDFAAMLELVNRKRLVPVVDRVYRLRDAVAAHQRVHAAQQMGKVVFDIAT